MEINDLPERERGFSLTFRAATRAAEVRFMRDFVETRETRGALECMTSATRLTELVPPEGIYFDGMLELEAAIVCLLCHALGMELEQLCATHPAFSTRQKRLIDLGAPDQQSGLSAVTKFVGSADSMMARITPRGRSTVSPFASAIRLYQQALWYPEFPFRDPPFRWPEAVELEARIKGFGDEPSELVFLSVPPGFELKLDPEPPIPSTHTGWLAWWLGQLHRLPEQTCIWRGPLGWVFVEDLARRLVQSYDQARRLEDEAWPAA